MKEIRNVGINMLNDIYDIIVSDEYLLRLLYHPPLSPKLETPLIPEDNLTTPPPSLNEAPDPKYREMWEIIDKHILKTSKSDDLEKNKLCRVYVYLGRQKPAQRHRFIKSQEIVFDVFCHSSYEDDLRLEKILSRIDDLISGTRVTGLGKLALSDGHGFTAPQEYVAYRAIYELGRS